MKKLFLLILLTNHACAVSILSEKTWITGIGYGGVKKSLQQDNASNKIQDSVKATTWLLDQYGFQGLENTVGSTHVFYAYNGSHPATNYYKFTAKLCDMHDNCVNYEKTFTLEYGQYYGETIYSSLTIFSDEIGAQPIYADTEIESYPSDKSHKQSMLILKPFPYD